MRRFRMPLRAFQLAQELLSTECLGDSHTFCPLDPLRRRFGAGSQAHVVAKIGRTCSVNYRSHRVPHRCLSAALGLHGGLSIEYEVHITSKREMTRVKAAGVGVAPGPLC